MEKTNKWQYAMCVDISVIKYLQLHTSLNRKISLISYTHQHYKFIVYFSVFHLQHISLCYPPLIVSENSQQFITQRFCYQCSLPSAHRGNMTRWRSPLWWVTGHNKLTGHRSVNHHHILLLHTQHGHKGEPGGP